jgi:predicted phage terminase large subunit-like protein
MSKKMTKLASDQAVLEAALRDDLHAFIQKTFSIVSPGGEFHDNWHIACVAHHLQQCLEGKIRRLIITLPPRNLKSICASVALPAFALGRDPSLKVIVASYSQELAKKHALDFRTVVQSQAYQTAFPGMRIHPAKCTETEVMTTKMGFRLSASVNGTLTGRGGNIIVIDDPLKPSDAMSEAERNAVNNWFDSTVLSRLDDKASDVIIIVMQRIHMDDLVGHVLPQGGWTVLNIPAIAEETTRYRIGDGQFYERPTGTVLDPVREPREALDEIKAAMGAYNFLAQYQQDPVPPGGTVFDWASFRTYDKPPVAFDFIGQSWDTACKQDAHNSFSVCTTWGVIGPDCYLLDVLRHRFDFPTLKKRALAHAFTYEAGIVLIEDTAAGIQLLQELHLDKELKAWPIRPKGDKIARAERVTARIEAGHVFIPAQAPWLPEFRTEIRAFPGSKFTDQVDSLVNFLEHLEGAHRLIQIHGRTHALCALNTPKPGYGPTFGVARVTMLGERRRLVQYF